MKKHLKLILRTFISNNACVEAARTKEPKYTVISLIFVLFALFFAALPTCVTGFQQNGGNILRGITYDFDSGMRAFGEKTKDKVTFELAEDKENKQHVLTAYGWTGENVGTYTWGKDDLACPQPDLNCFMYTHVDPNGNESEHKVLEVYHCDMDNQDDFNVYVEEIVKNINPLKIIGHYEKGDNKAKEELEKKEEYWLEKEKDKDGNKVRKNRSTSFIVFGKRNVQIAIYQPTNTSGGSGCYGDYNNTPVTTDLIHEVLVKSDDKTEILKDCQTFFDQVYVNPRRANTWRSTGIILGVDAGIILLMGFMVWILTRGKNNPFRIYSFWDGQKIAYYACLTPGIISLFGFLMSNMAMMLFILGVGVRVMWLSMRTLRYQAPNKQ